MGLADMLKRKAARVKSMLPGAAAKLTKLKMTGYGTNTEGDEIDSFEVMVNPETITLKSNIQYFEEEILNGQTHTKFSHYSSDVLDFKIILDGTGAIPDTRTKKFDTVKEQIDAIRKICVDYVSDAHEPGYVKIEWGDIEFYGRLQNMNITYSMFAPDGTVVRAEIDFTFSEYTDPETVQSENEGHSPDLTKIRVVKEGDTLPLLCEKMYNDSSMYIQVARYNGLVNFRNLTPGTEIVFPPIKK
ncbi:MAG: hypothetical protein OHK0057_27430 [Thermoflexibacter sp.]